jgi:predicted nucleic acid-binding protein
VTACVVDSSVAFKWFAEEPGSETAGELLRSHRDEETALTAPALLRIELANALRYAGLATDELRTALGTLSRFHLDLVEPDDELLASACRLALDHGLTVYDALFLALAVDRRCPLVTADRKAFGKIPASVCEIRLL